MGTTEHEEPRFFFILNKDILELVSLLRQVAARCAGWH